MENPNSRGSVTTIRKCQLTNLNRENLIQVCGSIITGTEQDCREGYIVELDISLVEVVG